MATTTATTATFSERRHLYEEAGVVAPSVTQVLQLAGLDDPSRIPIHYRTRGAAIGTEVHRATELWDHDDLDFDSIAGEIAGYVDAYRLFRQETGFAPLTIEDRGIAERAGLKFGYCVDRVGLLNGELVLIDLKTASKREPWWGIQTAGYADATEHQGPRAALHLRKDGKYKLIRHDDASDFSTWRGALAVAHWLLAHGRKLPR